MLDEHADQLFAMTDEIAERVRKTGATTIRSIGQIARLQSIVDNESDDVTAHDMLTELHGDEKTLELKMLAAHKLCDASGDVASASLLENWIDLSQRRSWFLYESTHC
jgi:starvation-inducible DNA-binding protein